MYPCGVDRRIRWPSRMRRPRTTRSLTPSSPETNFSPKTMLPAVLRSHQFLAPAEVLSQPSNTHALPVRTAQTFGGLFRWPCGEVTAGGQSARSQSTHCYRRGDLERRAWRVVCVLGAPESGWAATWLGTLNRPDQRQPSQSHWQRGTAVRIADRSATRPQ